MSTKRSRKKTRARTKAAARPSRQQEVTTALLALRDEGVFEAGRVDQTSVLFVVTEERVFLLHVDCLPPRTLDDYVVQLAVAWIDLQGLSSQIVAKRLGVNPDSLRRALLAHGYERMSAQRYDRAAEGGAHRRGLGRRLGNRRGRLVPKAELARTMGTP